MIFLMLGLSHQSAPVEIRDRAACAAAELDASMALLTADGALFEAVILSTCNRFEIYAVARDAEAGFAALRRFMREHRRLREPELDRYFCRLEQDEAIGHLHRVAAGLESQILGEGQILGQVKEALVIAQAQGSVGALLDALFRSAISAGKRVRTETSLARGAVSISGAAVELARECLGSLSGRSVLILGSGKMGELAGKQLRAFGDARIFVANRTLESATALALRLGGEAIPFLGLSSVLETVDVVFCCTGAPHYVLAAEELRSIAGRRDGKPMLILDVSVPRNVDPGGATAPGIQIRDLDDLHAVAQRYRAARAALALEVERMLSEDLSSFQERLRHLLLSPTIASWRSKVHALREDELERFWARHAMRFSPEQRRLVEELSQALLNKLMHGPLSRLKHLPPSQQRRHAVLLEALFELTVEDLETRYLRRAAERLV